MCSFLRLILLCLSIALVSSCGGSGNTNVVDEETSGGQSTLNTEAVLRLKVVLSPEGIYRFGEYSEINVDSSIGPPSIAGDSEFAVVAYDGTGDVIESFPFHVPDTRVVSYGIEEHESVDVPTQERETYGYLRMSNGIASVAIVNRDNTIIDIINPSDEMTLNDSSERQANRAVKNSFGEIFISDNCKHIAVVHVSENVALSELQKSLTEEAVDLFTPLLCNSVASITFAPLPIGKLGSVPTQHRIGDRIIINSTVYSDDFFMGKSKYLEGQLMPVATGQEEQSVINQDEYIRTVVHEAAHAAVNLIDLNQGSDTVNDTWPAIRKTIANDVVEHTRMYKQLSRYWREDMHNSYVNANYAESYHSDSNELRSAYTTESILKAGFFRPYGGKNEHEDIATITAMSTVEGDEECSTLSNYPSSTQDSISIPREIAAIYTKLALLRDLNFIDERDFSSCTEDRWKIPADVANGITVSQGGASQPSWHESPSTTIAMNSFENYYLISTANGSFGLEGQAARPAEAQVRVFAAPSGTPESKITYPRGIYRIQVNPFGGVFLFPTFPYFNQPAYYFMRWFDTGPMDDYADTYIIVGWIHVAEASQSNTRINVEMSVGYRPGAPLIGLPETWDPSLQLLFISR